MSGHESSDMSEFTHLERAILDAICSAQWEGSAALNTLLASARVIERDNTGHGFNTRFHVGTDHPALAPTSNPLNGPIAHMIDMGQGMLMGFLLWFSDGYPNCLEGYQYGDESGNQVDLRQRDLATLSFGQLDWAVGHKLH
jgi:hypothetical protein